MEDQSQIFFKEKKTSRSFSPHTLNPLSSLEGLLLVNKPIGVLSHDLVKEIRKLTKIPSVGHAGTLDPLASGLMLLLLGRGTKFSDEFRNSDKTYKVKIRFGITSDTWDRKGNILSKKDVSLNFEEIESKAFSLMGEVELPIPIFSAIKVNGKKLYHLARKGKKIDPIFRKMKFYNLSILDKGKDFLSCKFSCSKGSYVRSWSHFLGKILGVGALVEELHRLQSNPYSVEQAIEWKTLKNILLSQDKEKLIFRDDFKNAFVRLENFFPHWKNLRVTGRDKKLIMDGQISHSMSRRLIIERKKADFLNQSVGIKILNHQNGDLLALIKAEPKKGLKIKNCFRI